MNLLADPIIDRKNNPPNEAGDLMENGSAKLDFEENQWWTAHEQVQVFAPDGTEIYVDAKIADLMKALWSLGYETIYSCSGGESDNPQITLKEDKQDGYIYFQTEDMAENFMVTVEASFPCLKYPYYIESAGGLRGQVVRFHADMIKIFLKAFSEKASKKPVQVAI